MGILISAKQSVTGVSIAGGGVTNTVMTFKGCQGADYVCVRYWGASSAETPQASNAHVSWDGTTFITGATSPGSGGVGTGIYSTSPSGIDLSAATAEAGYPVFFWFNPGTITVAGMTTPLPIPYPNLRIRLQGNAAGSGFTVNADAWAVWKDGSPGSRVIREPNMIAGGTYPPGTMP